MNKRFLALDSCRGLCAVAVMLFHMDAYTHFYGWPMVRNSWVAVDFFFTLSGFVIASAYYAKLRSFAEMGRFTIRRFGRLYPLHISVLAVYVGIELYRLWALRAGDAFTGNASLGALAQHLFLVQGFTANHETWNYPAWSISVEFWTNMAFGLLVVLARRQVIACVFLFLALGAALITASSRWTGSLSPDEAGALLDAIRSMVEFLLGFLGFVMFAAAQARGWRPLRLAELAVVPLTAAALVYADDLPALGLPLIFLIVVMVLAFEAGPLSALLKWRPLTKIGTYSYSIYLTHSLYLLALEAGVFAAGYALGMAASVHVDGDDYLTLGGPWAMDGAALLCVCATIFGSSLTYRFIEEPARLFFNRLSRPKPILVQEKAPAYSGA
jgi:peptidoglycan/LPS O-acetylase OafA/YrhL